MPAPKLPEEPELFERIYNYRRKVQYLEREYLDLRVRLRDTESDLRTDPQNTTLKDQMAYLKTRINDLENRYPWIATGWHSEIPFCISSTV
jgi:hypothetical protein